MSRSVSPRMLMEITVKEIATLGKINSHGDLPPLFVPPFKLELVQYFPLETITKKDQGVKAL